MFGDKAKKTLKNGLKFLEKEGFKLAELNKTESKASGVFYTASYHSEIARCGVIVSYFPKFDSARASIENLDKEFNFSDSGAMKVPSPEYEAMEGEKEAKLENYLAALRLELLGKYKPILHGEKFDNDAFDWSPYK